MKKSIFSAIIILFVLLTNAFAEKENLVLLPLRSESLSERDINFFQTKIKESLSRKYNVFSGSAVEEKIQKHGIASCTSNECLQMVVLEFNGELAGFASIEKEGRNYTISLNIHNIITDADIVSKAAVCDNCTKRAVLRKIGALFAVKNGTSDIGFMQESALQSAQQPEIIPIDPIVQDVGSADIAILSFDSKPSGADVFINNLKAGKTYFVKPDFLPNQEIDILIKKEDYRDKKLHLTLKAGKNSFDDIILTPAFGSLHIDTKPAGADILLAGEHYGKTPKTIEKISSGAYLLTLKKDLYQSVKNSKIRILDGKKTVKYFDLTPNFGTLEISTKPFDAKIKIFDMQERLVKEGEAPVSLKLSPDKYRLVLSKRGYADRKYDVSLARGSYQKIEKAALRRLEGTIVVTSNPAVKNARVFINGKDKGAVPFYSKLPVGTYKVEVKTDGRYGKKDVVIKDKQTNQAVVELKKGGGKIITNSIGMKFVSVKPGTFMMGSNDGYDSEKPVHRVTFTKSFYMQTTEVTVGQWKKFINDTNFKTEAERKGGSYVWNGKKWTKKKGVYWDNPGFYQKDNSPVTCVSWNDSNKFIDWLNKKEGKKYRLPTEAEWEYAARGGKKSRGYKYSGSNNLDAVGWHYKNSNNKTHPVAEKKPNELGIYDMSGNVWEWCEDKWHSNYEGASNDGSAWETGDSSFRVFRGGSWNDDARDCRVAFRFNVNPGNRLSFMGFRLVLVPQFSLQTNYLN
jgi:formylglycine-generating enzyme required for sulfatase activity